jgi:hypothetical protein
MNEHITTVPEGLLVVGVDTLPKLKPSDILVFTAREGMTEEQKRFLNSKIKEMLAKNEIANRFLVLGPSIKLNVLRLKLS